MRPEIVDLTQDHLFEWYGEDGKGPTVKGVAGYVDGKLIAIAGFRIARGHVIAFCDLKPEARAWKAAIHRTAVRLINDAKRRHRRILAVCDEDEPTAPKWLTRLGFKEQEGGVWEWRTSA